MVELVVVVAVLAALGFVAALSVIEPELLAITGADAVVLGMVVGLPASALYHRALGRALSARGVLPRRWWLNPVKLHALLAKAERPRVMGWFYGGAVGFLLAIVGCGLVLVGVLRFK